MYELLLTDQSLFFDSIEFNRTSKNMEYVAVSTGSFQLADSLYDCKASHMEN